MASPTASGQLVAHPELRWIAVWSRAALVPAWRRALGAWVGCAIVSAVIFGPTAMQPADLTGLALHHPPTGAVLAITWLLIFTPTARLIVRPPTSYLASLPHHPLAAPLVGGVALVAFQLPWLALWLAGEGLPGLAAVAATTVAAVGLARFRPRPPSPRSPVWRSPARALLSLHLRALLRRAGDALLRGAGLAVLGGGAAGLLVRNNQLTGEVAGTLSASILAIVLLPAQLGAALVTLQTHREATWLAHSLGISRATRTFALVATVATVHLGATTLAVLAAGLLAGPEPYLLLAFPLGLGTALASARALLAHEAAPDVAPRVVTAAIVVAALAILCLAVLGAPGVLAVLALGAVALGTLKP